MILRTNGERGDQCSFIGEPPATAHPLGAFAIKGLTFASPQA
jgi:hypothetical protein